MKDRKCRKFLPSSFQISVRVFRTLPFSDLTSHFYTFLRPSLMLEYFCKKQICRRPPWSSRSSKKHHCNVWCIYMCGLPVWYSVRSAFRIGTASRCGRAGDGEKSAAGANHDPGRAMPGAGGPATAPAPHWILAGWSFLISMAQRTGVCRAQ